MFCLSGRGRGVWVVVFIVSSTGFILSVCLSVHDVSFLCLLIDSFCPALLYTYGGCSCSLRCVNHHFMISSFFFSPLLLLLILLLLLPLGDSGRDGRDRAHRLFPCVLVFFLFFFFNLFSISYSCITFSRGSVFCHPSQGFVFHPA